MKNRFFREVFIPSVLCNIITFLAVFVAVPLLCRGWADFAWISARIIAATAVACAFTECSNRIGGITYYLISVVQDIMGYVFYKPLSSLYGIGSGALAEFEYIGQIFVWITCIALWQTLVIAVYKYIRKNKAE